MVPHISARFIFFCFLRKNIGNRKSNMKVDEADRFAEMSMIEKNKTLAKMWRELPKEKKAKITKNFEKVTGSWYIRGYQWNLTKSAHQITGFCQIIETGSRGSFWLVVSITWQIQKCQNIETNAFQATWKSPFSNGFCQIPLIAPYEKIVKKSQILAKKTL